MMLLRSTSMLATLFVYCIARVKCRVNSCFLINLGALAKPVGRVNHSLFFHAGSYMWRARPQTWYTDAVESMFASLCALPFSVICLA